MTAVFVGGAGVLGGATGLDMAGLVLRVVLVPIKSSGRVSVVCKQ
jgi:hypothetical protein